MLRFQLQILKLHHRRMCVEIVDCTHPFVMSM